MTSFNIKIDGFRNSRKSHQIFELIFHENCSYPSNLVTLDTLGNWDQCDQIGRFSKVLGDIVSIKSSPNAWWIFGLKWKATLRLLNYCDYFLGIFWKILGYSLIQYLDTLTATDDRRWQFRRSKKITQVSHRKRRRCYCFPLRGIRSRRSCQNGRRQ